MSLSTIILVGNLGRDPETKYTPTGKAVTKFSLAVTITLPGGKEGDSTQKTTWYSCSAWGRTGEIAALYLKKGQQCTVIGDFYPREYAGRDGTNKIEYEVNVSKLQMGGKQGSPAEPSQSSSKSPRPESELYAEDIPF